MISSNDGFAEANFSNVEVETLNGMDDVTRYEDDNVQS